MDVKINLRIIAKNHAADPGIKFLTKSISKPYGRATAMPQAWELTPRLAAWPLRSHTALSNFLGDILQPTKSRMSLT